MAGGLTLGRAPAPVEGCGLTVELDTDEGMELAEDALLKGSFLFRLVAP